MLDEGVELKTPMPDFEVPEAGQYLWDWYKALSGRLQRNRDGVCSPIPPTEFAAWVNAMGLIVLPSEYECLCAMDIAYVEVMNEELEAKRAADAEKGKKPHGK